jgi:DNA-binding protein HU-beta
MPAPLVTQTQLLDQIASKLGSSRAEAKRTLTAVEDTLLENLRQARRVKLGNTVQLEVRVKPATKSRKGRNPATGAEITIAARPASVDVRARPLKGAKEAVPTIQKARKALAG